MNGRQVNMEWLILLALECGRMATSLQTTADVEVKDDSSPVTEADKKINRLIIERIKGRFPTDMVFGEEEHATGTSNVIWVVDPIDGTRPYGIGAPTFVAPAITRVENGEPTHAVVCSPHMDRCFFAEKGKGAFLREQGKVQSLHVANAGSFANTTVFAQCRKSSLFGAHNLATELTNRRANNLSFGSIIDEAMYVAMGARAIAEPPVAAIYFQKTPYDVAAARLIVTEAGGTVTDFFGENQRYDGEVNGALITNGLVHEELVSLVRQLAIQRKAA